MHLATVYVLRLCNILWISSEMGFCSPRAPAARAKQCLWPHLSFGKITASFLLILSLPLFNVPEHFYFLSSSVGHSQMGHINKAWTSNSRGPEYTYTHLYKNINKYVAIFTCFYCKDSISNGLIIRSLNSEVFLNNRNQFVASVGIGTI